MISEVILFYAKAILIIQPDLFQAVQKITADENRTAGNPYDLMYHASSPDEKAIVEACRNYGVAFLGERENENGVVQYRLFLSLSSKTKKTVFER